MRNMRRAAVTRIEDQRDRRVSRAVAARRQLGRGPSTTSPGDGERRRAGGRIWLNGIELGGTDPRHRGLGSSYD